MLGLIGRACALVGPLAGAPSTAPVDSLELTWRSPCMSVDQARRELAQMRLDKGRGRAAIAVTEGSDGRWAADVLVTTAEGETVRRLDGERCEDVSAGALIVAAGGLDAGGLPLGETETETETETEAEAEAEAEAEPEPEPETSSDVERPAETRPGPEPRWRPALEGFAEGGLAVGLLPGATGWVGGGVALQGAGFRLEAGGQGSLPRAAGHPDRASVQARVSVASGWVSGCWTLGRRWPRFQAPLCAGVEAGAMTARGHGLADRGTARAAWVAALAQARVRWAPRPWVALGVSVAVPVALRRLAFSADDLAGPVVTSRVVDVRVGPTIAFRWSPRRSPGPEKNGS